MLPTALCMKLGNFPKSGVDSSEAPNSALQNLSRVVVRTCRASRYPEWSYKIRQGNGANRMPRVGILLSGFPDRVGAAAVFVSRTARKRPGRCQPDVTWHLV
jgi:hypothetical protein